MVRHTSTGIFWRFRELLHCRPGDIIWEIEERDVPVDNLHVSSKPSSSVKAKAH